MIPQFRTIALAVFITGGLLSGTLGLRNLSYLVDIAPAAAPASATPPPLVPATAKTPIPVVLPVAAPATSQPQPTSRPVAAATATPQATQASASWLYVIDGNMWMTGAPAPIQLTSDSGIGQPALSDDGLVFVKRTKNASDVWFASGDGPPRSITKDAVASVSQNHWATQPVSVPGKDRMYVLADFNKSSTGNGDLAIWELGFGAQAPIQITRPPEYAGGDQDIAVDPQDPRHIVFTRYNYAGAQLEEQLQWLDVPTANIVPLTDADHATRQASYSPDAKEIAFVEGGPAVQENLYVADIQVDNGHPQLGDPRQVATGMIANPVWTADGNSLGYLALTDSGFQLFMVDVNRDADGDETYGEPRQLTNGPSLDATSRPVYLTPDQVDAVRQWMAPQ
ncbi:MAG: hypothetical protein JO057_00895 [Chloroflexi bacterium]|nr:hypothetical protein [Chloroflexota bacterium]